MGLKQDIISWNNNYPLDKLWRDKYKVPYGSPTHLSTSYYDMAFDLLEDKLFRKTYLQNTREGTWIEIKKGNEKHDQEIFLKAISKHNKKDKK